MRARIHSEGTHSRAILFTSFLLEYLVPYTSSLLPRPSPRLRNAYLYGPIWTYACMHYLRNAYLYGPIWTYACMHYLRNAYLYGPIWTYACMPYLRNAYLYGPISTYALSQECVSIWTHIDLYALSQECLWAMPRCNGMYIWTYTCMPYLRNAYGPCLGAMALTYTYLLTYLLRYAYGPCFSAMAGEH